MSRNEFRWIRHHAQGAMLAIGLVALTAQAQVNVTFTSKTFTPATIAPGGQSTLTVTVTNATGALINGATFTDTLPIGVSTAGFGNPAFSAGCSNGSSITINGTQFLGNLNVAANSTCVVQALVTSSTPGVYTNATTNISGWNGNALAFAAAALNVIQVIPTLSQFALILLALAIAGLAYRNLRGKSRSGNGSPA